MKKIFENFPLFPPNVEKQIEIKKLIEKVGWDKYSEKEKREFDAWRHSLPFSSPDHPIRGVSAEEVVRMLPSAPNYTEEEIGFFLETKGYTFVHTVFEQFVQKKNYYELAAEKIDDAVFFFSVGTRFRGIGRKDKGFFFAHSHSDFLSVFQVNKSERKHLPTLFIEEVLPSEGDLQIFLSAHQVGKKAKEKMGERIYSQNGWLELRGGGEIPPQKLSRELEMYRDNYFDLFLSKENKFKFTTIQETKEYFKDAFHISIEYHPFHEQKNKM